MGIRRYIKNMFQHIGHTRFHLNRIDERLNPITSMVQKYHAQFRVAILQDKIVNCTTMGITSESICDHEVIVSLTTHGKRIFKMSPIHHHYEMSGWSEVKIVTVFTTVAAIFAVLSYFAY